MRRVYFSFDWDVDVWRVYQVRNSWLTKSRYDSVGFIDSADIEKVKRYKDDEIKKWINNQLVGTSVTCVLIGSQTANSRWVNYEIIQSIEKENGLLGVYIHNVRDKDGYISKKGDSPFHKPPMNFAPCKGVLTYPCCSYYDWVNDDGYENLANWIEKAAQQAGR